MSDLIVRDGPEDRCFGCGQQNRSGLQLRFRSTGPRSVESEVVLDERWAGAPGVVHGGIQAALLDEVCGMAAHAGASGEDPDIATVEFHLRYRRPARTGEPLTVRGRLVRVLARDFHVEGEIVDAEGNTLTEAEARWRRID